MDELKKLVDDLYWDYDRMSSSGQETLDKIAKKVGIDEPIFTSDEVATEEFFALGYFHDGTNDKYIDESKYTVIATKEKEITDKDDIELSIRDYEWRVEVFLKKGE